ncbi:MAG: hypothetical protein NZZ41_02995 [Candidatus Dojkabacteria bacterium]|nr:hypothetical protein [Candidatus Dojkabacteria bacterium]
MSYKVMLIGVSLVLFKNLFSYSKFPLDFYKNEKKYFYNIDPYEIYQCVEVQKFLKNSNLESKLNELINFCKNCSNDHKYEFVKNFNLRSIKSNIVFDISIDNDIFSRLENTIDNYADKTLIQNSSNSCVFKYKDNYIIINFMRDLHEKLNLSIINNFHHVVKNSIKEKNISNLFEIYFKDRYASQYNHEFVFTNIAFVIDECKSFLDPKFILKITEYFYSSKELMYLIIVNSKGEISYNIKTIVDKSLLVCNLNFVNGKLVKNSLDTYIFGKVLEDASIYISRKHNPYGFSRSLFFLLENIPNFDNSLNYLTIIDKLISKLNSRELFEIRDDDYFDMFIFKPNYYDKIYFNTYFISKYDLYKPFRISAYYCLLNNTYRIKSIKWNDVNKKDPLLESNKKGISQIIVGYGGPSNKLFFLKKYKIAKISKNNRVYFTNYKNLLELPYIQKNQTEILKKTYKYFIDNIDDKLLELFWLN